MVECYCFLEEQASQSPRLSLTGVGDAKESPPQTSKANPWCVRPWVLKVLQLLVSWEKGPLQLLEPPFPGVQGEPMSLHTYLLTSTLPEHKGSLQWE